jgi:hypothetical protein
VASHPAAAAATVILFMSQARAICVGSFKMLSGLVLALFVAATPLVECYDSICCCVVLCYAVLITCCGEPYSLNFRKQAVIQDVSQRDGTPIRYCTTVGATPPREAAGCKTSSPMEAQPRLGHVFVENGTQLEALKTSEGLPRSMWLHAPLAVCGGRV